MVSTPVKLEVRLFAVLRERLGGNSVSVDAQANCTAGELRELLKHRFPDAGELIARSALAINAEYAADDQLVPASADLALIPPVSGGSRLILVTTDELSIDEVRSLVAADSDGAICLFLGVVRNHNDGHEVTALEYDAYVEMAEKQLAAVADETREHFDIDRVALHHRIGRLEVGEVSLLAAVSSAHRREAFEACHWAVDRLKERVPIWKKEFGPDGATWLEGNAVSPTTAST
jgi:molybdopterin synthase catalytic subunit